jgi:hypothetical protein
MIVVEAPGGHEAPDIRIGLMAGYMDVLAGPVSLRVLANIPR